jgi:hypothetical protein
VEHLSLKDVASRMQVKPYQIVYAISVGLVPEPALRVGNKRVFQSKDVKRIAAYFAAKADRKRMPVTKLAYDTKTNPSTGSFLSTEDQ